ncbi:MAG: hypothetical protein ACK4WF_06770, partial [Candidatus Brocadiales bacterium]
MERRADQAVTSGDSTPWKCVGCKSHILGYSNSERNQIRIKYKDLYAIFEMTSGVGQIGITCRKCGLWNTIQFK